MKNIDFLPQQYRERARWRRSRIWQIGVLVLFSSVVGTTLAYQVVSRGSTRIQLATVTPQHSLAVQQTLRHTTLRSELSGLQHQVSLYTYLQHPWPRTQILAQIASQLPKSCVVSNMRVINEVPKTMNVIAKPNADKVSLAPAEHDLKQLLDSQKSAQTIVYIHGNTDNPVELYEFVAGLSQSTLFSKAELRSFETVHDGIQRAGRFEIRTVVAPGLAQFPDGDPGEPVRATSQEPWRST